MTLTRSELKPSVRRIGLATAAAIVLGTVMMPQSATAAEAPLPIPDGLSEASAAASCWEIKQNTPTAPSGTYWLATPQLGSADQFYCDQETSGGGWLLVGRGREDWSTSNEGAGTPAQVRTTITGPSAFAPRQLSSTTIEALLGGSAVSSLPDGIRLRRATVADGSTWQESTFKFSSPRVDWSWMFDNEQRVGQWKIGARTGSGGTTSSFGSGSALERIDTIADASRGAYRPGFGFGTSVRGSTDSASYLWAPNTTVGNPRPFTQMFLRPQLRASDLFAAIPETGTPKSEGRVLAESFAKSTVWGVDGLGAGPSSIEGSNEVSAFAEANGVVYVGGNFTSVQKTSSGGSRVAQSYIAAFNVNTGEWISTFRPSLNNQVKALAVLPDGRIAAGGYFTQVNGQPQAGLVVLNPTTGATDAAFGGRLVNRLSGGVPVVRTLDVQGNWLYAGGVFTHSTGGGETQEVYTRSGARFSTTNGRPDATWNPEFNGTPISVDASVQGDRVYYAGFFSAAKGQAADKAAAITTTDANPIPWNILFSNREGGRTGYQQAIREVGSRVWVGGSEHSLFSYDRTSLANLSTTIGKKGGDFQAISTDGSAIYGGCHCFHTQYYGAKTWSNVGTSWTRATKINSVGAWDAATGAPLPNFSPILTQRNGAGAWTIFNDSTGTMWAGGDFTGSKRAGFVQQWSGGFVRFGSRDVVAPTSPSALTVSQTETGVAASWTGSTDARGPVRYQVLRNDRVVGTTTGTSLALPPAPAGTKYFVRATDDANNLSASTPAVVAGATSPTDPTSPVLVAAGSTWNYSFDGSTPPAGWNSTAFDATAWSSGPAPIGFGHSNLQTTLTKPNPVPITAYYTRAFDVADASKIASITLTTRADDGIVVYVNGVEVVRRNIDPGTVTPSTYANTAVSAAAATSNPVSVTIPGSAISTGKNVVSAEVHSNYRTTPSASFELSANATFGQQPPVTPPTEPPTDPPTDPPAEPGGLPSGTAVVPTGSTWSYLYQAEAPAATWRDVAFDASAWPTGAGALGYGSMGLGTQIATTISPRPISTYFRKDFDILSGALPANGITLRTRADDGVIVFVNGVEAGRSNLIAGAVTHTTYANSAPNTTTAAANPVVFEVPANALTEGRNVISVQVVSNYRNSPSISFDLSAVVK